MSRVEEQAKNFANLCKGNPVSTIMKGLRVVNPGVLEVLKTKLGTSDVNEIAVRLSMGC